jgi:hypothetical protein
LRFYFVPLGTQFSTHLNNYFLLIRWILRELARVGYITIKIQRGRGKSNLYTINRQKLLPVLPKIGSLDCRSKPAIAIAAELLEEEERKKEGLLRHLGLEEGSTVWIASMNGHLK